MKALLALTALITSGGGHAQTAGDASPSMSMPNYSTLATSLDSGRTPLSDTPTMQLQKLSWAVALPEEAHKYAVEDGGSLNDAHQRYVQRRANEILTGRR